MRADQHTPVTPMPITDPRRWYPPGFRDRCRRIVVMVDEVPAVDIVDITVTVVVLVIAENLAVV